MFSMSNNDLLNDGNGFPLLPECLGEFFFIKFHRHVTPKRQDHFRKLAGRAFKSRIAHPIPLNRSGEGSAPNVALQIKTRQA